MPATLQFAMMTIPEQPKPKIPTTRGDDLRDTHVKLGEMSLISKNSFIELNGLLELLQQTEQCRRDPELRRMRLRMQTIAAALEKMSTEIDYILLLTKGKSFASRYTGAIEARERYKRKLASRMGLKTSTCTKTESLLQLEQAIAQDKPSKRQKLLPQKERQSERDSCKQVDIVNKKFDLGLPLPANKHHYMLRELVLLLCPKEDTGQSRQMKVKLRSIKGGKRGLINLLHKQRKFFASYQTYMRHELKWIKESVLPAEVSDGAREGRPAKVSLEQVPLLNKDVHLLKNKVETTTTLAETIQQMEKEGLKARHMDHQNVPLPSRNTVVHYNKVASLQDGVSLVNQNTAKDKNRRRQTASMSTRNCMAKL